MSKGLGDDFWAANEAAQKYIKDTYGDGNNVPKAAAAGGVAVGCAAFVFWLFAAAVTLGFWSFVGYLFYFWVVN